jgi:thioredoxin-dependent peroxiredoxin
LIRKFPDVQYFMISVDPPETNKAFAEQEHADFPMLSDPSKTTATAYGVLGSAGMANRWTFYIGTDGKILAIDKQIKVATAGEDLVAKLKELGIKQR